MCRGSNDERQNEAQDIKQVSPPVRRLPPLRGESRSLTPGLSHHALTLAIDGKLYLSPLQRDKIKVSLLPSDRTVAGVDMFCSMRLT